MKYVITYNDDTNKFMMNGVAGKYVGDHLYTIAKENGITTTANSESHHLVTFRSHGIEVELLEEDGSRMVW